MHWWVSTDWHIEHANIIAYERRPPNHTELLIERHKELLNKDDGLLCLGDVIFGERKDNLREYLDAIECKVKVLMLGNHDKKPTEWYLEQGFDMVCQQIVLNDILFSHAPTMLGQDHALNVHGHLHRATHRAKEMHWYQRSERHVLLSAEYTDYYPISLRDLRNGRYTVDGVVYFIKGCTNGHEAKRYHVAETRRIESISRQP